MSLHPLLQTVALSLGSWLYSSSHRSLFCVGSCRWATPTCKFSEDEFKWWSCRTVDV